MNVTGKQFEPVRIGLEIQAEMYSYPGDCKSSTATFFTIEVGWGRSVLTLVHNVPEEVLANLLREDRKQRTIVLGTAPGEPNGHLVLKRVLIDGTEYILTDTF